MRKASMATAPTQNLGGADRGKNGLRVAVVEHFRTHLAEFVLSIQLCTDLERMPVEDASNTWPEDASPYRPVTPLILPPRIAWSEDRAWAIDEALSFGPAHSLEAHRPLGSIMRARMRAYADLGRARSEANGYPLAEPRSPDARPA